MEDRELSVDEAQLMTGASPEEVEPLRARPQERFLRLEKSARGPFLALLAVCFVLHAGLLAGFLIEQWTSYELPPPEQEVAVEVVPEVPKPEEPPPPAPQPQAQQPPMPMFERFERTIHRHEEAAPSQQKLKLDDKIATDAPRAEKENASKLDAPDDETKSQRVAQPKQERSATEPEQQQQPQKAQQEQSPEASPDEQATAPKLDDKQEKRDAEVIEQAAPNLGASNDKKGTKPHVAAAQGERQKSIAEIVASLSPAPEFKSAGRSHGAPISGGSSEPEYKSVVYGYIMRKFGHHGGRATGGVIKFWIDPRGTLAFQELYRSSGSASLDQEALSALRRAAPFPPTPTDGQVSLIWTF